MQDESIVVSLSSEFGLDVVQIAFLPLGADQNTAFCRASADDTTDYFAKLRLGDFDEASVALPRFLSDQGVAQVMAPLETEAGRLWTNPESACFCTHSLRAAIATRLACRTIIGLSSAQPSSASTLPLRRHHWSGSSNVKPIPHSGGMP